jgi:hypothetical protein
MRPTAGMTARSVPPSRAYGPAGFPGPNEGEFETSRPRGPRSLPTMSKVKIGRAGSTVVVDLDVCVKTGLPTRGTVTLRGSTTPPWVGFLLLVTVIGYLFANVVASKKFQVTLPYTHVVYDRWQKGRQLAYVLGLAGVAGLVLAVVTSSRSVGLWAAMPVVVIAAALVIGIVNGRRNGVGIAATRHDDLILTRVHPAFAAAVRESMVEPLIR